MTDFQDGISGPFEAAMERAEKDDAARQAAPPVPFPTPTELLYEVACLGNGEELSRLEWLAMLLHHVRTMGPPHPDDDDPERWRKALGHCEDLLRDLRFAFSKSEGVR